MLMTTVTYKFYRMVKQRPTIMNLKSQRFRMLRDTLWISLRFWSLLRAQAIRIRADIIIRMEKAVISVI